MSRSLVIVGPSAKPIRDPDLDGDPESPDEPMSDGAPARLPASMISGGLRTGRRGRAIVDYEVEDSDEEGADILITSFRPDGVDNEDPDSDSLEDSLARD